MQLRTEGYEDSGDCDVAIEVEGEVQAGCDVAEETSPIKTIDLENLVESQEYRCALCGEPLDPQTAALDHKTPVTRGGQHCIENVQWVTKAVNRAKNTMTNEEFVRLCKAVADKH